MTEDYTRPVALPEAECRALKERWRAITQAWIAEASDEDYLRWADMVYPSPLLDKLLSGPGAVQGRG